MADRVVLHVGLMKSGTTYVQHRLSAIKAALLDHGVLFPGASWADQVKAVRDLYGAAQRPAGAQDGDWQRLVDEIDAHDGTALVSMEFLAAASPEHIARVARAFAEARIEVVVTVRDVGRSVPAYWQTRLRSGELSTFGELRRDIAWAPFTKRGDGPHFWLTQGIAGTVRRWGEGIGFDRVTVVTLPPRGGDPEELWRRFCLAAAIPALSPDGPEQRNDSIGAQSAALLHAVNVECKRLGVAWDDYRDLVKDGFAPRVLVPRRASEDPIGYRVPLWLRLRAARHARYLARSGARVVGDLADLRPESTPGIDPDRVAVDLRSDEQAQSLFAALSHSA